MKRVTALLLACLLLCGCGKKNEPAGIRFYYPRKDYVYQVTGGSVGFETRDVTQEDLSYVLRVYLLGPQDEALEAVYPSDIRLESAQIDGSTVTVRLSPIGNRMTDISFTLAASCLAKTCFSLTGTTNMILQSGDRRLTLEESQLTFQDTSASLGTEEIERTNE